MRSKSDQKSVWPALWLFALLRVPFGVFTGFIRTPLPYLLRSQGVSVDQIANMISFISLPAVLYFLWSPLVDFGIRRRSWLILASFISALALAFSITQTSLSTPLVTHLLVVGFAVNLLTSSASGGLLASTVSEEKRARASGWYQAGSLGAGTLAGGFILLLLQHFSPVQVAWVAALLLFIPSLSALLIEEPTAKILDGQLGEEISKVAREVKTTFWSLKNAAGLLLIVAPIGTGAAASLFAGMAPDYQVSANQVGWLNGLGGGIILALGALLGGLVPANWDPRLAYIGAGSLNALCSFFLFVTPISAGFYFAGLGFYQLTTGICYACFTSLVFNILGSSGRTLSSRYTVMVALSNAPVIYMTWFEGRGYQALGMRSVAAIDGLGNLLIAGAFLIYWLRNGRARSAKIY